MPIASMQSAWWLGVHLKNHRKPRAAPQISTLAVPDHHIMASPNTMGRWNFTWAVGSNFQGMFLTAGTESLLDNISLLNIWAPSFHIGKCKLDGKQGKMQGSKTLCKGRIPPVRERLFASDWWRGGLKRNVKMSIVCHAITIGRPCLQVGGLCQSGCKRKSTEAIRNDGSSSRLFTMLAICELARPVQSVWSISE